MSEITEDQRLKMKVPELETEVHMLRQRNQDLQVTLAKNKEMLGKYFIRRANYQRVVNSEELASGESFCRIATQGAQSGECFKDSCHISPIGEIKHGHAGEFSTSMKTTMIKVECKTTI